MDNSRVVRAYRVLKVLEGLSGSWVYATYILFLDGMGIPDSEKFLLNAIFMVAGFFMDPPTGRLGDKVGHWRVYVAGLVAVAVGFFVYGSSREFAWFAVAEVIVALGMALRSQALESWMRNRLGQDLFHKGRTRAHTLMRISSLATGYAGSVVGGHLGYDLTWYLGGGFFAVTAVVGILILRNGGGHEEIKWGELLDSFKELTRDIHEGLRRKSLRPTFLIYAIMAGLLQPINMLWSLTLQSLGVSPEGIGSFWIGISVSITLGTELSHRVNRITNRKLSGSILLVGGGIAMGSIAVLTDETAVAALVIGFLVHEVGRGLLQELLETARNEHIQGDERAFINSVVESTRTIGSAVGLLIFGQMTKIIADPLHIWLVSAGCILALGAAVWFFKQR